MGRWRGRWQVLAVLGGLAAALSVAVLSVGTVVGTDPAPAPDPAPALSAPGSGPGPGPGPGPGTRDTAGDAPAAGVPTTPVEAGSQLRASGAVTSVDSVDRTLVRTVQLGVEVADLDAAGRQVRTAVAGVGGDVSEEQSDTRGALFVLRVPAAALDRLLEAVGGIGRVVQRSGQVVDATEEVVDLDARVVVQRAGVDRVRALLTQARTVGDVVAVESELSRRQAELDSLVGRLTALRDQAARATVTVDLRRAPDAAPADRAAGFVDGLGAGWDGLRAVGLAVALVAGVAVPFLPVAALLVGAVWLVRRVLAARRAA